MSVTYNGTDYYYVLNIQGDIIGIVDNTGTQVVSYTYDAWGNALTVTGTMAETLGSVNPLRYRGYVYDTDTELFYLQSRYYNPEIGRFLNADALVSTGQGLLGINTTSYCLNNPVRYIDSLGNRAESFDDYNDEYDTIGFGIQVDYSCSKGGVSGGGGIEVIVFWDAPECKQTGKPVVAVYIYGEIGTEIDPKVIGDIISLLTESADLLKVDGVSAAQAVLSVLSAEHSISLSGFVVQANNEFSGISDYEGWFQTKTITIGSIKAGKAWGSTCRTYSIGYSYTFGKAAFRVALPVYSRGVSYYSLIYASCE